MPRTIDSAALRTICYLTALAGAFALAATVMVERPAAHELWGALVLAAVAFPLMRYPYRVRAHHVAELDELVFCFALFTFSPAAIVLALTASYLVHAYRRRQATIKLLFNGGLKAISTAVGVAVAYWLGFADQDAPGQVLSALAGAAALMLVTIAAISLLSRARTGDRAWPAAREAIAAVAGPWFVTSAFGVTVALAAQATLWVLPMAAMAVALAIHTSYARFRHREERFKLNTLHLAGQAFAEAHRREQVEAVASRVTSELLAVARVELRQQPPGDREYGAKLPSQGMWLVMAERTHEPFSDIDRDMLASIVNLAESALRRIELVEELERQSLEDHLTGAGNRRWFERAMAGLPDGESRRACLALFDVDLFKELNDEHGHEAGDRILVELTSVTRQAFRSIDLLFRLGGDEFVLILPGLRADQAADRVSMLQSRLGALRLEHNGRRLPHLRISVGVVEFPVAAGNANALLQAADEALYAAKRAGRNRVVICGAETVGADVGEPMPAETHVARLAGL